MSEPGWTLGELSAAGHLEFGDGYRTNADQYGHPGLPILRVAQVRGGRILPGDGKRVREEYRPGMGSRISRPGDVVLTTKGTVGRVAVIPEGTPEWVYSPQLCYFRVRPGSPVSARYLYYWFQTAEFRRQAGAVKTRTIMDYLSLSDIRSLRISHVSPSIQAGAVEVLAALDDKVAVNDLIVTRSDALRAGLLRSFMADRPDDVQLRALSSVASFVNGRDFTKDATGTGRMVVRIGELNSGPGDSTVYNDIEVDTRHLAGPGDILFGWSGSLSVARWFRPEAIVNQHIFKVVPLDGIPDWLVFELLQTEMPLFRRIAAGRATTIGHIKREHLDREVTVPVPSQWARLHDRLGGLWERALSAELESHALVKLRDRLLPGLVAGDLRVGDTGQRHETPSDH